MCLTVTPSQGQILKAKMEAAGITLGAVARVDLRRMVVKKVGRKHLVHFGIMMPVRRRCFVTKGNGEPIPADVRFVNLQTLGPGAWNIWDVVVDARRGDRTTIKPYHESDERKTEIQRIGQT